MNNMIKNIKFIAFCTAFCFISSFLYAQEVKIAANRIVNGFNQPIQGAIITIQDDASQWITAIDGQFKIPVTDPKQVLMISAAGYLNLKISVRQLADNKDVVLVSDPHNQGGMVNFGMSSFAKESVTGAVASVSGRELEKTPSNILSETFVGRLPGLTVVSDLAELTFSGYNNTTKTIRGLSSINGGTPLVVLDGVIAPTQYIEFISPQEIESVTVLKDAASTAIYGIQGAAGVIVITTKRGYAGKLNVEAYADHSFQEITRPLFINSAQFAELRNEAGLNDGLGKFSQFSQEDIDQFRLGTDIRYPNNNWYKQSVRDYVMRQKAGLNVTGGTNKFRYFSNLNFLNQQEPFIITEEPERIYDPTPHAYAGNFRTNMDVQFNKNLAGYMRLTGNIKQERLAGGNLGWNIYEQILKQPSTMFGPVSPLYEDLPDVASEVVTIDGLDNPVYGMLNRSGYRSVLETNVIAQGGLKLDMGFLTKGLSASGGIAYQTYARNETGTNQSYKRVVRSADYSKLFDFVQYKTFENTPLTYNKASIFFYYLNLSARLDYSRKFGDHAIDASAFTYYLTQEKEFGGSSNIILPYKRQNSGVSVLYGYKDRYFLKGDVGYGGSEQFHRDHRYTATPAISGAWIASKEDFFANPIVSLLKLRASYGITGNDQLGEDRLLYLDNIRSDGSELGRGNLALEAERVKKTNYGLNLGFFNMFTLDVDYFVNKLDNMLINSSSIIPEYQGVPLDYYPMLNDGKMENKGYEIALGFNKHFSKNFSMYVQGNVMQAKNKVLNINESALGSDYSYPLRSEGFSSGQLWGYQVDKSNGNGMFNSATELANSGLTYSFGTPRAGDLIYKDLNNDGLINEKDQAPMGYARLPQQEYTVSGGFKWKSVEFSFLLQGVNKSAQFLSGIGAYENMEKGIFNDIHLNAWTVERYAAGENISYPALSLSPSTNHVNNDFFLTNRSYLRLRNVELAYTLPEKWSQVIHSEKIRIALNAQNLFTIQHMNSDYIDPEIGSLNTFQPYRVFNIGVRANF